MIVCSLLRYLILVPAFLPLVAHPIQVNRSASEPGYSAPLPYSEPGDVFRSNVPLNEINVRAFRHFRHRYAAGATAEYWFKSADGYQVSFNLSGHHQQAFFDLHGIFLYAMKYYDGKDLPRETGKIIKRRYPDYNIDVVTEITDGVKTFYRVQIVNPFFVKTLSVIDDRIEVTEELINGGGQD
jgi:hypothetical protein